MHCICIPTLMVEQLQENLSDQFSKLIGNTVIAVLLYSITHPNYQFANNKSRVRGKVRGSVLAL